MIGVVLSAWHQELCHGIYDFTSDVSWRFDSTLWYSVPGELFMTCHFVGRRALSVCFAYCLLVTIVFNLVSARGVGGLWLRRHC
jgi:hypothetical protein